VLLLNNLLEFAHLKGIASQTILPKIFDACKIIDLKYLVKSMTI